MENGGKRIKSIKLYACGYCVNNLRHVFKKHPTDKRNFPALVVLIQHNTFGNILFDTGYSELIYRNHIVSMIYNLLNKTYVKQNDTILSKLTADGINAESIHKIILSHAHPDHIAGLQFFDDYELISTEKVIRTLQKGNAFQLVFRNMVPKSGVGFTVPKKYEGTTVFDGYFDEIYDVLGDGSVLGVDLSGHADGQLGIYLPEFKLLFAADACWGSDLLKEVGQMRFAARLIQTDYRKYVSAAETLERFSKENPDIKVIYSHGAMEEKQYEQ